MDMSSCRVFIYIVTVYNNIGLVHMAMISEKIHLHQAITIPSFPSNDTSVFQTLVNVSVNKCVDECKRLRVCALINYHVHEHQCHMIKSNGNIQVINSPGNAYGKKMEWNLSDVVQGCSTCADAERCDFESGTVCDIEACGPPPSEEDTVLYGNNYRTGDTLLYKCSDNMTVDSGSISHTTCQNNGQWSSVNITCTDDSSSSSSCPVTFRETILNDGTDFAYLYTTSHMNYANALEYCQDQCGQLVEVLTQAKFDFLKDMLLSLSVDLDFYINGNYDSTTDKFITSSGIEIPFSYSMWESSPAYFSTSQACIRLRRGAQYKINTHQCNTKYGVICEKP